MDKIKNLISPSSKDGSTDESGEFTNKYKVAGEGSHFGAGGTTTGIADDSDPTSHMPGAFEDDTATTASVVSGVPGQAQSADPGGLKGAQEPPLATREEALPPTEPSTTGTAIPPSQEPVLDKREDILPPTEPSTTGTAVPSGQEPVLDNCKDIVPPTEPLTAGAAIPAGHDPVLGKREDTLPPEPSTIGTAVTSGEAGITQPPPIPLDSKVVGYEPVESYLAHDATLGPGACSCADCKSTAVAPDPYEKSGADPLGAGSGRSFPLAGAATSEDPSHQKFSPGQIGTYPAGGSAPATVPKPGPEPDHTETGPIVGSTTGIDTSKESIGTGPTPSETGQITGTGPVPVTDKTQEYEPEKGSHAPEAALAAGVVGAGGVGAYEASKDDVASPSTGPAPNTAGPHKSDLLNKLDPRVDSDLSKQKGDIQGQETQPATLEPSETTKAAPDLQYKRDGAVAGAGGAGALAGYEAEKQHTQPGATKDLEPTTAAPDLQYKRDDVGIGAGVAGVAAGHEAGKPDVKDIPTEQPVADISTVDGSQVKPLQGSEATTVPTGGAVVEPTSKPTQASKEVPPSTATFTKPDDTKEEEEDHTKRNALLAGGAGAAAGAVAGNELSEKEAQKAEKEQEKELKKQEKQEAKEQKAHEKAAVKEQKEQEKSAKKEQKELEKQESKDEKKHGGILGLFKRDKSDKELADEQAERKAATAPSEDTRPEHRLTGEEAAVGAGAAGVASGAAVAEGVHSHDAPSEADRGIMGPDDGSTSKAALKDSAISSGSGVAGPADAPKSGLEDSTTEPSSGITGTAVGAPPAGQDPGLHDDKTIPATAGSTGPGPHDPSSTTAAHERDYVAPAAGATAAGAAMESAPIESRVTDTKDPVTSATPYDTTTTTQTPAGTYVPQEQQYPPTTTTAPTREMEPASAGVPPPAADTTTREGDHAVAASGEKGQTQPLGHTATDNTTGSGTGSGSGIGGPTTTHDAYGPSDPGRNKLHKDPPKKILEQRGLV